MLELEKYSYEEEEISLYDIVDIVLKYKKKIVIILLFGFCMTLLGAFFAKKFSKEITSQEYRIQYSLLEKDTDYQVLDLHYIKFDPREILEKEQYMDHFLEIPEVQKLYAKEKIIEKSEVSHKRKFIQEILQVTRKNENSENSLDGLYTIQVKLDSNMNIAPKILETYFTILDENSRGELLKNFISKKTEVEKRKLESETILTNISQTLEKGFYITPKQTNNKDALEFIARLKYPLLMGEKEVYEPIYQKALRQDLAIHSLEQRGILTKIVERNKEVLVEATKSNTKLVLLGGIFITVCLAFLYIIFSEFLIGYQKYKIEKRK